MSRLADDLARLAERGPQADARQVVARALAAETIVRPSPVREPVSGRRRPVLALTGALAAAAIVITLVVTTSRDPDEAGDRSDTTSGLAGTVGATPASVGDAAATTSPSGTAEATATTAGGAPGTTSGGTSPAATDTTAAAQDTTAGTTGTTAGASATTAPEELEPVETLPASGDLTTTPVTVSGTEPTEWYRLLPDLDVAWLSNPSNSESELCFRSPAISGSCRPDELRPIGAGGRPAAVVVGGEQIVVIVSADDAAGRTSWTVRTASGGAVTAPLELVDILDWGIARFDIPVDEIEDNLVVYPADE